MDEHKDARKDAHVRKHTKPRLSIYYTIETVTIALEDLDFATMRVGVGTGGLYAVEETIEVGQLPMEVRAYCRQIERKLANAKKKEGGG